MRNAIYALTHLFAYESIRQNGLLLCHEHMVT